MFDNIETLFTNAHGEINFFRVTKGKVQAGDMKPFSEKTKDGAFIVGHSESGHHHVLESAGATVMERQLDGMRVLYAILENPGELRQGAAVPHESQTVEPGEYIITTAREYDPFTQQARRVAD